MMSKASSMSTFASDRAVLEPLQGLGHHLEALVEERFDEALGLDAHAGVVVDGRVGHRAHELAVGGEDAEDLAPVDAGAQAVAGELDVGGVDEHADTGRRGGDGNAVGVTARGLLLEADEVLDLAVLLVERAEDGLLTRGLAGGAIGGGLGRLRRAAAGLLHGDRVRGDFRRHLCRHFVRRLLDGGFFLGGGPAAARGADDWRRLWLRFGGGDGLDGLGGDVGGFGRARRAAASAAATGTAAGASAAVFADFEGLDAGVGWWFGKGDFGFGGSHLGLLPAREDVQCHGCFRAPSFEER